MRLFSTAVIRQRIQAQIETLLHFTDDQSDHEAHYLMLAGFLDAMIMVEAITDEQKRDYLMDFQLRLEDLAKEDYNR